jgi:hypothetical protein
MTAVEGAGLKVGIKLNIAGSALAGILVSIIIGASERGTDGIRLSMETGAKDVLIGEFDDGMWTGR